jgi:hypothetical protein
LPLNDSNFDVFIPLGYHRRPATTGNLPCPQPTCNCPAAPLLTASPEHGISANSRLVDVATMMSPRQCTMVRRTVGGMNGVYS